MVKKILIGFFVFIIIFIGIVGFFIYNGFGPNSDLAISDKFANTVAIEVFQNNNYDFLLNNSTPKALEEFKKDKSRKMFSDLKQYFGEVKSISEPITEVKSGINTETGSEKIANSYLDVEFKNGKGRIYLTLKHHEKRWKIQYVNLKKQSNK